MRIEKINDNQIKCILTRSDLASRQLKLSELAYGTEKAKGLFQDMMEQANLEFGFDASDVQLMVEAIPVSMDCIILMVTKVENPDDVDTRFSSLSTLKDMTALDFSDDYPLDDSGNDVMQQFQKLSDLFLKKPASSDQSGLERVFSFDSLESVIEFSSHNKNRELKESTLYESPDDGRFYLLVVGTSQGSEDFARICSSAPEFGVTESSNYARIAYMDEHFKTILNGNALESLAYV